MKTRRLGAGWYLTERPYWRGYYDYQPTAERGPRRWLAIAAERCRVLVGRIPYGPTRRLRE